MPPLETPESQPQPVHSFSNKVPLLYVLLAFIGTFLIVIGYFFYSNSNNGMEVVPLPDAPATVMVEPRPFTPEGTILLSLVPKDGKQRGIYAYDVTQKTLAPYLVSDTATNITASFGSTTEDIYVATNSMIATSSRNVSLLQIAKYNKTTETLTALTKTSGFYKRHPRYSSALNLTVYSGKKDQSAALGATNDFFIYTRDDKGFEKEVATGSLPVLSPDGRSVVALQEDGLVLVDLANGGTQLIWPVIGKIWMNAQFTVSPKGKYIAWSNPNEGLIYVMTVESWMPFKGTISQRIDTHAFWPVFSANEEYLAFEEVDWTAEPSKPRLVIHDLVTPAKQVVYDLDGFDQMKMFISDWR